MRNGILVLVLLLANATAAEFTIGKRTFEVPIGFVIEQVTTPDLIERPIVADFDQAGNLYVAESSGTNDPVNEQLRNRPHWISRLTDSDNDGVFDKRTRFADRMMFPEGALWHDGSLYVAAPPSIWKLTDADGDGIAEKRTEWFQGKTLTGCANDLHGPYLAPDGWIYWCKGAFAKQDYVLPDGQPFSSKAAHIFRARPDGSSIEPVMTGGMDNPVEIVFTDDSQPIFTTTFLQHPRQGRRDGLIHAIYGGVYGKNHGVLDGHPRTGELLEPLAHLGAAAPSGLLRYDSDAFGREFVDDLFSTSFNLKCVWRHQLARNGATFQSTNSKFLVCDSTDFHPTDVLADADGSLLVIDTGGWYKLCCPTSQLRKPDVLGAIYRVRRDDSSTMQDPRGRSLNWASITFSDLVERLIDHRPVVRKRAVDALANERNIADLRRELQRNTDANVRLQCVQALCRIGTDDSIATSRIALRDADLQVRLAALHAVSLYRDKAAPLDLRVSLASEDRHERRRAAEAAGRLGNESLIDDLLVTARPDDDRATVHAYTYALIEIGDVEQIRKAFAGSNEVAIPIALIALDQLNALTPRELYRFWDFQDKATALSVDWIVKQRTKWGSELLKMVEASGDEVVREKFDRIAGLLTNATDQNHALEFIARQLQNPSLNSHQQRQLLDILAAQERHQLPPSLEKAFAGLCTPAANRNSSQFCRRSLPFVNHFRRAQNLANWCWENWVQTAIQSS